MKSIDLAQEICICDVFTLAIHLDSDVIKPYFFLSVQTLPTNIGLNSMFQKWQVFHIAR